MYNIFLIDDHRLFLDGLQYILKEVEGYNIQGFTNPLIALEAFKTQEVHLVVTDINMNELNGLDLMIKLREINEEIKILAVSVRSDASLIKRLLDQKIEGYLPKNSSKDQFIGTVKKILEGEKHYDMNYLINNKSSSQSEKKYLYHQNNSPLLTEREKEVLQLIVEGETTIQIAEQLYLSEHTINSHRKNIAFKLDTKNLAELITKAVKLGLAKI